MHCYSSPTLHFSFAHRLQLHIWSLEKGMDKTLKGIVAKSNWPEKTNGGPAIWFWKLTTQWTRTNSGLILKTEVPENYKKAKTFQKMLNKCQKFMLYFLNHSKVPPVNKGAEIAIRNIKVNKK
jgi:hypothetical protein